jgi:hypothetical protein
LCSCSQRCSVIGGPGSTLLAQRPGCSFIRLGFRSLPLCCCIQRGTPFFWPLRPSPSGVALRIGCPLASARLSSAHPSSRQPSSTRTEAFRPPSSPATRHALPRSDRLVPARIRPDALALPGIVPPSHLVASPPPVPTRPSSLVRALTSRIKLIGTAESTQNRRLPQDRQLRRS